MTRKEMLLEAVLVSLCKFTIFVVYPALYYFVMKDKQEIYPID